MKIGLVFLKVALNKTVKWSGYSRLYFVTQSRHGYLVFRKLLLKYATHIRMDCY